MMAPTMADLKALEGQQVKLTYRSGKTKTMRLSHVGAFVACATGPRGGAEVLVENRISGRIIGNKGGPLEALEAV